MVLHHHEDAIIGDIETIFDGGHVTASAMRRWDEQVDKGRNNPADHYGGLLKMLRIHNSEYYQQTINPLLINHKDEILSGPLGPRIDFRDPFTFRDMRTKNYRLVDGKINYDEIINDLKRIVVVVDNTAPPTYYYKVYNSINKRYEFVISNERDFKLLLEKVKIGKKMSKGAGRPKNITLWSVFVKKMHLFTKRGMMFYADNDEDFSYFQGYNYNILSNVNMKVIQGFLDHIKEVTANNDERINEYLHCWFANLLQHPDKKNKTCLVITGPQGAGKTEVFTNIWSKVIVGYSNGNETSIKNITGDFNAGIENMKLVIINEMKNADTNQHLNCEMMKTLITDDSFKMNQKFEKVRKVQNVANFILVTNDSYPVHVENGDRRYVVIKVSGKHVGDFEYFDKLISERDSQEFYDNLYTYYMKMDLTSFDPRKIPMTDAKRDIIEASKNSYELFVQDFLKEFDDGINCQTAWDNYKDWVQQNGYQLCSNKTFGSKLKDFCDRKRKNSGDRKWYYQIAFDKKKLFDYSDLNEMQAEMEKSI